MERGWRGGAAEWAAERGGGVGARLTVNGRWQASRTRAAARHRGAAQACHKGAAEAARSRRDSQARAAASQSSAQRGLLRSDTAEGHGGAEGQWKGGSGGRGAGGGGVGARLAVNGRWRASRTRAAARLISTVFRLYAAQGHLSLYQGQRRREYQI